jgi:hypothetical protein
MKKLIKLLFPKTYKAIYDEGYNTCYSDALNSYAHNHDYYDDYEENYDDQYPEGYWVDEDNEPVYEEETYADHYNNTNYALHGQDDPQETYAYKPHLEVGDKIHLHSRQGMYTVTQVFDYSFAFRTNSDTEDNYADYDDYKCHAGGLWNFKGK